MPIMKKTTHVILPWHLAEPLPKDAVTVLLQDHHLRPGREVLPIHKLKLAWNMAVCVEFKNSRENKGAAIAIVDWAQVAKLEGPVSVYDPLDHDMYDDLVSAFGNRLTVFPLVNSFIMGANDLRDVHENMAKRGGRISGSMRSVSYAKFFKIVKEKTDTLVGVASTDAENRRPLPRDGLRPSDLPFSNRPGTSAGRTCEACAAIVERDYASSPGSTEQLRHLPITQRDAVRYFELFLDGKLADYGAYQDAIDKDSVELYHSHCSHLINAGLLTPEHVIRRVMARKDDIGISMNNVEGFVRQLLGWREYMRFIYHFWGRELKARMVATGGTPLDFEAWNRAGTGIAPIDGEIRKVLRHAWSHHIVRLMVFMNFMKLTEVRPLDIYRWFMSLVSLLDAYEWVMVSNVMAMGYFDRRFMTRHYVSSSKYLLRMSNYEKDGRWDVLWDELYKAYVAKHGIFGSRA